MKDAAEFANWTSCFMVEVESLNKHSARKMVLAVARETRSLAN